MDLRATLLPCNGPLVGYTMLQIRTPQPEVQGPCDRVRLFADVIAVNVKRFLLSPYPKSVTRGSVTLPRYMDFDTRVVNRPRFGGSKLHATGYTRKTRVTTRRVPLFDATSRDVYET